MVEQTELDDVDKHYVDRISRHINFPNNDESLKLFRQYRDKILKKQIAADNERFGSDEFLEKCFRQLRRERPNFHFAVPGDPVIFAKHLLKTALEITAHREASMSFMLQIYENEMKLEPRKNSKPNLKLIK